MRSGNKRPTQNNIYIYIFIYLLKKPIHHHPGSTSLQKIITAPLWTHSVMPRLVFLLLQGQLRFVIMKLLPRPRRDGWTQVNVSVSTLSHPPPFNVFDVSHLGAQLSCYILPVIRAVLSLTHISCSSVHLRYAWIWFTASSALTVYLGE